MKSDYISLFQTMRNKKENIVVFTCHCIRENIILFSLGFQDWMLHKANMDEMSSCWGMQSNYTFCCEKKKTLKRLSIWNNPEGCSAKGPW